MTTPAPRPRLRAVAYIDGFNFYYRSLKYGSNKWINLETLLKAVFPEHDLVAIKYFTADVADRQWVDASGTTTTNRQQLYLRALRSTPTVKVIKGHFLVSKKKMPVHPLPPSGYIPKIKVVNVEEKGSDVNLATELLLDAFNNVYDVAIVVSIDSDLERPIDKVVREFGKVVHLSMGGDMQPGKELRRASGGRFRHISDAVLEANQFPETVTFRDGSSVTCPASWRKGYVAPAPVPPPVQTVKAVVRTVKGKQEQGEIEIAIDPIGRLIHTPGQLLTVQRLPIVQPEPTISPVMIHVATIENPGEVQLNSEPQAESDATIGVQKTAKKHRQDVPWWVFKRAKKKKG